MSERYEQHIEFSDRFDSVNEQILVVVYDTLREVTTITFRVSETGDTLRTDRVTDRQTNEVIVKTEKLSVVTNQAQTVNDTLLIADTVIASESEATFSSPTEREAIHTSPSLRGAEHCEATKQPTCRRTLFWVFAIISALTVLVYLIKIKK